ncbi:hypothetical protein [Paenibacillus sp. IITD108]|uniref:hypothetical protein n=1 Tax=Paenibacillus sp. IITD108 TaxID=3116649 RepID=UPI002F3EF56D
MTSCIIAIVLTIIISIFYISFLSKKKQYKELTFSLLLLAIATYLYVGMRLKLTVPNPISWIEIAITPLVKLMTF